MVELRGHKWGEEKKCLILLSGLMTIQYVHGRSMCYSVLQCVAVCCNVLQCVVVCCSVLQCVTVCCSALQCVAVCRSALQCVAMCCSVLQCGVAVSCQVGQGSSRKEPLQTRDLFQKSPTN